MIGETTKRREDVAKAVKFRCRCGERWTQMMKHYEIVRCKCGAFYWVLQPKRDGDFQSFPWSGPNPI